MEGASLVVEGLRSFGIEDPSAGEEIARRRRDGVRRGRAAEEKDGGVDEE